MCNVVHDPGTDHTVYMCDRMQVWYIVLYGDWIVAYRGSSESGGSSRSNLSTLSLLIVNRGVRKKAMDPELTLLHTKAQYLFKPLCDMTSMSTEYLQRIHEVQGDQRVRRNHSHPGGDKNK